MITVLVNAHGLTKAADGGFAAGLAVEPDALQRLIAQERHPLRHVVDLDDPELSGEVLEGDVCVRIMYALEGAMVLHHGDHVALGEGGRVLGVDDGAQEAADGSLGVLARTLTQVVEAHGALGAARG